MNMDNLSKIGIIEYNEKIIGLITYENEIGEAYLCLDGKFEHLKPQLIDYAVNNHSLNGQFKITLPDGDLGFQQAALIKGFYDTNEKTFVARIDVPNIDFV